MGLESYISGIVGEYKACAFLKRNKFEIVMRNFHSKFGEIDIIAKKEGVLHFIEVKLTHNDYEPAERLDTRKYKKLIKTIEIYQARYGISCDFQLDLICIKNGAVEFRENISF
ncbi:YraN family protein [Campylobacter sp. MIT 21-1685]|uniref:YraN family protein n=1 Tax=unclassified Campylobacter TaxID=2593542 RepID=UPI00224B80EA|nr:MULTISPECIES: YraN family protein [unclassified Campylobacter]MCX2682715.1 YraN family protein [Campylobacter sp. MIT 21-1684]MCX2750997.1 YraN family protein [Campylobacter sp. MIT 21-1682]MCX2807072.1 YraN family protein [Campylobacter sp. MIT 21-1685]